MKVACLSEHSISEANGWVSAFQYITETARPHDLVCDAQVASDDGSLAFSPITYIPHFSLSGRHEFVQLRTASATVRRGPMS